MTKSGLVVQVGVGFAVAIACSSDNKSSGEKSDASCVVCGLDGGGGGLVDGSTVPPGGDLVPLSEAGEAGIFLIGDAACQGIKNETEAGPASLEMVVDVSGSMSIQTPTTGGRSKWAVTRDALIGAVASLPANAAAGITFYPNMATDASNGNTPRPLTACVNTADDVGIAQLGAAGSAQRDAITTALNNVTPNRSGGTPTYDAYSLALPLLQANNYTPNKYMLLITDGQPTFSQNCVGTGNVSNPVDPQPIVQEIAAAYQDGIKTFLIGSPGSESNESTQDDARPWLSQAAREGGTAPDGCADSGTPRYCHFDMTAATNFSDALTEALKIITNSIITCIYPVNAPVGQTIDYAKVNLIFTNGSGAEFAVVQNKGTTCDRGWHFINDNTQIEVCGETCTNIKADPGATMEVLFGCEPISGGVY